MYTVILKLKLLCVCVQSVHGQTHNQTFAHIVVKGLRGVSSWPPPCGGSLSQCFCHCPVAHRLATLPPPSRSNGVTDHPASSDFHLDSKDQTLVTRLARLVSDLTH